MLAKEDGPADAIVRLRRRLGNSLIGEMMDCFNCLSLWVAVPMTFFLSDRPPVLLLGWLALSGAAILLERVKSDPLAIERAPDSRYGETSNALLWPEEINVERSSSAANPADR